MRYFVKKFVRSDFDMQFFSKSDPNVFFLENHRMFNINPRLFSTNFLMFKIAIRILKIANL